MTQMVQNVRFLKWWKMLTSVRFRTNWKLKKWNIANERKKFKNISYLWFFIKYLLFIIFAIKYHYHASSSIILLICVSIENKWFVEFDIIEAARILIIPFDVLIILYFKLYLISNLIIILHMQKIEKTL